MKKIIIIITIIVLISIIIFLYNRKSEKNGFTGTIYTINYCEGKDHCDKLITIGKKIPSSIKQYKSSEVAIKDFNNKKMYYKHIIKNDIVKESYVELYNTDISKYLDDMMYRFKYMFRKQNYCMYYTMALDFTMYGRMFYINKMDYDKDNEIITADIYLYTYPITTEAETSAQVNARTAMNNKEFDRAKKLIVEDSDGKYERKTIRFKINNNGKFFKYQIISIKTTDK